MAAATAQIERLAETIKDRYIHALLRGASGDEDETRREGQIFGLDLAVARAIVLVNAASYIQQPELTAPTEAAEARSRQRARDVIAAIVRYFRLPNDTICAYIGDGEIAILKASSTRDLAQWADGADSTGVPGASWANLTALKRAAAGLLQHLRQETSAEISIGVGRYHPGIAGLARSYEDARTALSLGTRLHGPNRVHCLDGLGIAAFVGVSDQRTKAELAARLLSPLDHEPELLQTVEAFLAADCCPSLAASQLAIHRNTLGYRLDRVAALTGLDPHRFDDAVQLRLAGMLRSLAP